MLFHLNAYMVFKDILGHEASEKLLEVIRQMKSTLDVLWSCPLEQSECIKNVHFGPAPRTWSNNECLMSHHLFCRWTFVQISYSLCVRTIAGISQARIMMVPKLSAIAGSPRETNCGSEVEGMALISHLSIRATLSNRRQIGLKMKIELYILCNIKILKCRMLFSPLLTKRTPYRHLR